MQGFVWCMLVRYFVLFLVENTQGSRLGEEKRWLPDLEWSTRTNWENDKIPDHWNRIMFPLEMKHSVGLPIIGEFLVSDINLPRDGSLLLHKDGILMLGDSKDKKFEGKVSKWKWSGPFFWVDPENWNGSNPATPHLEKIPCSTDTVILPGEFHSLSIKLPNVDVKVKKIKIGSSTLGDWDWRLIMEGREFRKSRQTVKYSGLQYCASEDCLCRPGDDTDSLINEICAIETPRCKRNKVICEFPLEVEGHCCGYCGGRVRVERTISLSALRELSNEALKKYKDTVSWHTRVTWNENLEILIAENGKYTGIKSLEAVNSLVEALTAQGVSVMSNVGTGAPLEGSIFANTLGPMLGIPVILILLFFAALPYFGYSYSEFLSIMREIYSPTREGLRPTDDSISESGSFGFARFENVAEGAIQLASTAFDDEEEKFADTSSQGKRFENPLYRSERRNSLKKDAEAGEEKIIDINLPFSLSDLQARVEPDNANVDSE